MKITFVLPHASLSGGTRIVALYAEQLYKRGHQVCVVSIPRKPPGWYDQVRSLVRRQGWLTLEKSDMPYFDGLGIDYRVLEQARPVVDADVPDADVVIATWWETAEWVAKLSEAKGAKAYLVQHHEVFEYLPVERVAATYRLPLHKIAIAEWLVQLMAEKYGDCNVSLVPNSIDLQQFDAPLRPKQAVPTIGTIYSTAHWKGTDIGLEAIALATQQVPNLRLVTFGTAKVVPHLPLPPGATLALRPPQDQLKGFYSQCDAWLFTSRSEGFGLPILEAMACRTPVIGVPSGAAPELLQQGAGILVPPEDPVAMAEAIAQICQMSEAEWQVMSSTAYARARIYTLDQATEKLEAALQMAIQRDQRGDWQQPPLSASIPVS